MTTKTQTIWNHCNACGQQTEHKRLRQAKRRREIDYEHHSVEYGSTWQMLQCKGCHEVSLERTDWSSEDEPGDAQRTYFPPRVSRRHPAWFKRSRVPPEYRALLNEVYAALHADSHWLATMGARALLDAFITKCVGDQGNFAKGLDKLVSDEFITQKNREIVDSVVDAGNASAHGRSCPSSQDLNTVIDIVENLIQNELLKEPARVLKANTPPRQRASKNKKKNTP